MAANQLQNSIQIRDAEIEFIRLKTLYSPSYIFTGITFCLAILASSVMWQSTKSEIFFYWFLFTSLILIARFVNYLSFNAAIEANQITDSQHQRWENYFCALLVMTGLSWFVFLYLCGNYSGMFETGISFSCICTLVAVSIQVYSHSFKSYACYASAVLLPSSIYMIFSHATSLQVIGHIGFYFFVVTLFVSWTLSRSAIKGIKRELENYMLIQTMDMQNAELIQLNKRLEEDINKRNLMEQKILAEKQKVETLNEKLLAMSSLDGLTGIANQFRFSEFLNKEWDVAKANRSPISLLLCNVDYLSAYNEKFGTQRGDKVICILANFLEDYARKGSDIAARLNGDKFALLFASTSIESAKNIADRLHEAFYNLDLPNAASSGDKYLSISIGVASMIPLEDNYSQELLDKADKALTQAKLDGKNRVSVARMLSLAANNTSNKHA